MPYVPSEKTDGQSQDRNLIDPKVEALAQVAAAQISNNLSLIGVYENIFLGVARALKDLLEGKSVDANPESDLAQVIYELGDGYGYEGAYLGEVNYAFTRFIQRVPQIKVERGDWKEEIRYWLYAATVEALMNASHNTRELRIGLSGVFEDITAEYKRRVNHSYEAAQIMKSGDCYDAPYYTRLVEVVDSDGKHVGYQEIMLKRSEGTLNEDVLVDRIVLKKK